jgi:hypothetical protein
MKGHEIERHPADPEKKKTLYRQVPPLLLKPGIPGSKVFDTGNAGVSLNVSSHCRVQKLSLSFSVRDADAWPAGMFFRKLRSACGKPALADPSNPE